MGFKAECHPAIAGGRQRDKCSSHSVSGAFIDSNQ